MASYLIIIGPSICGFVYLVTALAFFLDKRPSWALTYFAYALANIGLIWASLVEKS
jgi:heme O synthase-like polyprenyltransferase